jgi:hypothetical protein
MFLKKIGKMLRIYRFNVAGSNGRRTNEDAGWGGVTPSRLKNNELIILDTPESSVKNNYFEESYHDLNHSIGLAERDADDSDKYSTSVIVGKDDDESEEIDFKGTDDKESEDYSMSPDICEKEQFVHETSSAMNEIIRSSTVCSLAAENALENCGDDHTGKKCLEGTAGTCASPLAGANSTVCGPLATADGSEEFDGNGLVLHMCQGEYEQDVPICVACPDGGFFNIHTEHNIEQEKDGELEVEQMNASVGEYNYIFECK